MKRSYYLILILGIPFMIGILTRFTVGGDMDARLEAGKWPLFIYIILILPILVYFRMRYQGKNWRHFLYSMIPFVGLKERFSTFRKD